MTHRLIVFQNSQFSVMIFFLLFAVVLSQPMERCYISNSNVKSVIKSPLPQDYIRKWEIPNSYDPRNMNGRNLVSTTRNQHIPNYCGACWSFAATATINDRLRIATNGSWPEVDLSMQVLLNCDKNDNGCHGGNMMSAFAFIRDFGGIPDEGCHLYGAVGHDTGEKCEAIDICQDCNKQQGCFAVKNFTRYTISEYGEIRGEDSMLKEIYARGPISCGMAVTKDLVQNYTGGIYEDKTGTRSLTHGITVEGWGEEKGIKYWIVRNSWGKHWGESGWFRIVRGKNNLGIESDCSWAVPVIPDKLMTREYKRKNLRQSTPFKACKLGANKWNKKVVKSPLPHTYLKQSDLPETLDYRNFTGINMVTWDKNQHIPKYCGSCWAQAVTSMLSDRLTLQRKGQWPSMDLSPQVLLNCNGGGSCSGGWPDSALDYIETNGISDQTCQPYLAVEKQCKPLGVCYDCLPSNTSFTPGECTEVKHYMKYSVSEYSEVQGADQMKAELFARGPITCGIMVTDGFSQYTHGIYSEKSVLIWPNHEIEIVGWGKEGNTEYWIGRNSWGTYWGMNGWFYIKMHEDNLGIEKDCTWGIPTYEEI